MQKSARYEMLTKTKVGPLILKLAFPTIISMMVTALYNAADTYFVGKISTEATAAVGIVFSAMAIIQAIGFFFGHGSGNFLSRMLGAGRVKKANEMASTGFALAIISGLTVAILGNIFIDELVNLIGATKGSAADTKSYMQIILIGAPFMMAQFVVNNQLRFQGSAMYAMIGLCFGAVINVGLDPLLIFTFDMGVKGAAIATVAGQAVSFVALLIGSFRGENIHLNIKNVKINKYYLLEVINGGSPSLLRQGLAAISTVCLNRAAGRLGGDPAIAGMSVVTRVMLILSCVIIGFGQGYQPVCSFNYGANLKSRVKEGYFFCVKYGTIFFLFLSVICFLFTPEIISIFRNDPKVIEVGVKALRFQALTLPLNATIVITNMMLQSTGHGLKGSIMASAKNGIFFLPMIFILPAIWGITGVEAAQAVADVCAFILSIPMAWSELKKM